MTSYLTVSSLSIESDADNVSTYADDGGSDTAEGVDSRLAASDAASESSTVVYGHEEFESFQHRVRALLSTIYTADQANSAIVTRLAGGGFNRVVGVTVADADQVTEKEYILRVPRFDSADISLQVQTLSWLSSSTNIPVPKVVAHDSSNDNPIGDPYMLMEKLDGVSLYQVIDDMSDDDRVSMAEQVAGLIGAIHTAPVPPGIGPLAFDDNGGIRVGRYTDDEEAPPPEVPSAAPTTFRGFLATRFKEQRDYCQARWPDDTDRIDYCDRLLAAAETLVPSASDRHEGNVLFHSDFAARNILVRRLPEDAGWAISGVLDWDDCTVAPAEVAFSCPGWLWAARGESDSDSFDENDCDPDEMPFDELGERIKDAFFEAVEIALPGYMDTIRVSRARRLRQLHRLAETMIHCNEDVATAELVISVAELLSA
ncbi:APH-domain-containing protein [Exidia glandulosa HHB12029]|uniref:APH-domain-containing protein n=1 Tax=Exidia glandulosa HHB12029 TaxID=1314781 RepID=A0A165DAM6_EXIGL|nr:APH-domain-containing protein [Exidia glandulosa HHB12029]